MVAIAEELNLGLDALVFVDDNPAEREIVRTRLPEVAVPEGSEEGWRFADLLEQGAYFEPTGLSREDLDRSAFYEGNRRRDHERATTDYDSYLRGLRMTAEIGPVSRLSLSRVAQLVNKTNQFNLTTRRCTTVELEAWRTSDSCITLCGRLDDKFGSNGIITALVGTVLGDRLEIVVWVMSCRVFGRHMELALFDSLVDACRTRGIARIEGRFTPTMRNGLVADLYERLGFELVERSDDGSSSWRYVIPEDYRRMNGVIECG